MASISFNITRNDISPALTRPAGPLAQCGRAPPARHRQALAPPPRHPREPTAGTPPGRPPDRSDQATRAKPHYSRLGRAGDGSARQGWSWCPSLALHPQLRRGNSPRKGGASFLDTVQFQSKPASAVDNLPRGVTIPAIPNVQSRIPNVFRPSLLGHEELAGLSRPPKNCRNCPRALA